MPCAQPSLKTLLWLAAVVAIISLGVNLEIRRRLREKDAQDMEEILRRVGGASGDTALMPFDAIESDPRLAALSRAAKSIESLHEKKRPPEADDWLAKYHETGQTFEEYLRSNPNRPSERRTRLYVQPIGEFTAAQRGPLNETADLLSRFYDLPVRVLDPLVLDLVPPDARRTHPNWGGEQVLTTYVLYDLLKPRLPDDAVAMLALTTADLWPGEGNFVFGQASRTERVGVWSLYRYGDADDPEAATPFRRRLLKVALHETGHMLGIAHCIAYECCVNGSNSLAELDSSPMWLCPQCVQKVWWACSVDPPQRYQRLVDFATRHRLAEEAEFWASSRDRVE
ncbi:MAG TPA: archaemetzincin [Pirellulales bacterium]|jgi:archaemetzincin|nr:archaemetzincin [Pirellulales bacterium]